MARSQNNKGYESEDLLANDETEEKQDKPTKQSYRVKVNRDTILALPEDLAIAFGKRSISDEVIVALTENEVQKLQNTFNSLIRIENA